MGRVSFSSIVYLLIGGKEGVQKERNGVRECNGNEYDAHALYICLKLSDVKQIRKEEKETKIWIAMNHMILIS